MDRLSPAQLGADDVIRFADIGHFLSELEGPLGRGQALVRTRRTFKSGEELAVQFEAPGVSWRVSADVRVEALARGRVGFEVLDFDGAVRPRLDALAAEARGLLKPSGIGAAQIAFDDSDEPPTGQIERPPLPPSPRDAAPPRMPRALSRAATPLPELMDEDPFGEAGISSEEEPADEVTRLASVGPDDMGIHAAEMQHAASVNPETELAEAASEVSEYDLPAVPETTQSEGAPSKAPPKPTIIESPPGPSAEETELKANLEAAENRIAALVAAIEAAEAENIELESAQQKAEEQHQASQDALQAELKELQTKLEEASPAIDTSALDESHPAVPRATSSGIVRLTDSSDLLGLYMSQIRHGRLTLFGGPEKEPGSDATLKFAGSTVVSVDATILARVGPWTTFEIPDASELKESLRDRIEEWQSDLPAVPAAPAAAAPAAEPSVAASSPSPSQSKRLTGDLVPEPAQEDSVPPAEAPAAEVAAPAAPTTEKAPPAGAPSAPPRLDGTRVIFASLEVLTSEMENNLANGGLFVESSPLPLRDRRALEVVVGNDGWGVQLQADVVFADGGKVGFSVSNASEALKSLRSLVAEGGPANTADLNPNLAPSSERTADLQVHQGSIGRPFDGRQLLAMQSVRLEDLAHPEPVPAILLAEAIIRKNWRGVLTIESGEMTLKAWFHEGSIAFVDQAPSDNETFVGRILIQQKKINEGIVRDALEKGKASRRPLGRMLVSLGHVRKSEMVAALREQTKLRMDSAFGAVTGTWQWSPWTDPPGQADVILTRGNSVLGRYVRNALDHMNVSEIEALFGQNITRAVRHCGEVDLLTQGLGLQPKEQRFLELSFDGKRSIHDASLGSPIGKLASLRLVGVCLALGVSEYSDGRGAQAVKRGVSNVDNRRFAELEQELKDSLQLMSQQNHFEVLGVHWSGHHRNYREAFETASKKLDLRSPRLRDAPPNVKQLAKQALGVISAAHDALKDEASRIRYRKEMFDRTEREYAADMLVKQGEVALMRSDRVEAMELLETAVELNPSNRNRLLLQTAREGRR